uniref:Uncharacterized protein n=1 Tax=Kalanchoe fedtschenkoi TaxID=63787 RepID=A0A7N0ZW35_KALFE
MNSIPNKSQHFLLFNSLNQLIFSLSSIFTSQSTTSPRFISPTTTLSPSNLHLSTNYISLHRTITTLSPSLPTSILHHKIHTTSLLLSPTVDLSQPQHPWRSLISSRSRRPAAAGAGKLAASNVVVGWRRGSCGG